LERIVESSEISAYLAASYGSLRQPDRWGDKIWQQWQLELGIKFRLFRFSGMSGVEVVGYQHPFYSRSHCPWVSTFDFFALRASGRRAPAALGIKFRLFRFFGHVEHAWGITGPVCGLRHALGGGGGVPKPSTVFLGGSDWER
jgi:hypothetical protein